MNTEGMTKEERAEYWALVVEEFNASVLTKTAYCKKNQITVSTLNYWIGKRKELEAAGEIVGGRFEELILPMQTKGANSIQFDPVPYRPQLSLTVNGIRIDVHAHTPMDLLRQVITEVRSA